MCDIDKTKGTFSLGPDSSVRSERKKQIASSAAIDFIHGSDLKDFCCPIDPKMEHTNIWVMCIYILCDCLLVWATAAAATVFPISLLESFWGTKKSSRAASKGTRARFTDYKIHLGHPGRRWDWDRDGIERKYNGRGEHMCMMLVAFVIGYIHKRNVRKEPKLWNGRGLSPGRRDNLLRDRTKSNWAPGRCNLFKVFISPKYFFVLLTFHF